MHGPSADCGARPLRQEGPGPGGDWLARSVCARGDGGDAWDRPVWRGVEVHVARVYTGIILDISCAHTLHIPLHQYVCGQWLGMGSRVTMAEEMAMEKVKETVYYYTFINDLGETVRPRRPGTLAAIKQTRLASATPLMRTALEVDEADLDEDGFYPRT